MINPGRISASVLSRSIWVNCALTVLILWGCSTMPTEEEGFVSLFNNRDLGGWVVEPKPNAKEEYGVEGGMKDSFGVVDGCITRMNGGYSWIRAVDPYSDFILKVEYRISQKGNSGIHFRVGDPKNEVYDGIEMQILDDHGKEPGIRSTGAIYGVMAPKVNASRPAGEWNDVVLECRDSLIRIDLNGIRIIEMDLNEYTEPVDKFPIAFADLARTGYVGFQNHGSDVSFRNIRIRKLASL